MQRIRITDKLDFSRIIYGMWRLADDADTSVKNVHKKIDLCLEQGITTFDQADIYGDYSAEAVFGYALKENKSLRDQIEIITKCGIIAPCGKYSDAPLKYYDTSSKHIISSVESSLTNMNIEHIDMLLIHRPDPFMNHLETGMALDSLVESGKIGAVGVSNFKPHDWELLQSGMKTNLKTNQIELSLKSIVPFKNGDVAFHQKIGTPIMAWSPLAGGDLMTQNTDLTNKMDDLASKHGLNRSAIAVAWLLAHPANIMPVMGTNNLLRISEISDAINFNMNRITWFDLYTAALGKEVA
ncbi:MAG: aldo/keto reductase [Amylibacter sp.]|jgi:predicted oxidoreductase|tara:strand:- start:46663 stop:47553 length:891 start_codon:yes stop_codon:yes gene_type:complete